MESTKFMRDFVNFLRFDKPHNSIPFLLTMALFSVVVGGILMAIFIVEDQDSKIAALQVPLNVALSYLCIINNSVNPQNLLELVRLIEEEFFVSRNDFKGREEAWKKIEEVYRRKSEGMTFKFKCIKIIMSILFSVFFCKNAITYFLKIPIYTDVQSPPWVTPFLWFNEPEFKLSAYVLFIHIVHCLITILSLIEGYLVFTSVCLSIDKLLADFETIYILLENISKYFPDSTVKNENQSVWRGDTSMSYLRKDMARIVQCHQHINRNYKICADNSAFVISAHIMIVMNDSCINAYFILKSQGVDKVIFIFTLCLVNLGLLFIYQNGQRIINQNVVLRQYLAELPWIDKPRWFRQTVHIMMTRANVDFEIRPYGIFVLNYNSFKDLMKLFYSVGNVLYTRKLAIQSHQ